MSAIRTRVAQALFGDNAFCGCSVNEELAGTDGWASVFSLAIGGPRLCREDATLVEDLAVCSLAADPRIWPLKMTRIVASYGAPLPAIAVGHLALEGAIVGSEPTGRAAETLVAWAAELGDDPSPESVEAHVAALLSKGRAAGFGVAFRGRDERVDAIRACLKTRGRDEGRHWKLVAAMDAVMQKRTRVQLNLAMASAAVLLDLGFTPVQIRMWMSAYLDVCFYANAVEGAESRAPELLVVPAADVTYVGRPPRTSPRAIAKRTLDSQAPALNETAYR